MGLSRQEYWNGLPFPYLAAIIKLETLSVSSVSAAKERSATSPGRVLFVHSGPLRADFLMVTVFTSVPHMPDSGTPDERSLEEE